MGENWNKSDRVHELSHVTTQQQQLNEAFVCLLAPVKLQMVGLSVGRSGRPFASTERERREAVPTALMTAGHKSATCQAAVAAAPITAISHRI